MFTPIIRFPNLDAYDSVEFRLPHRKGQCKDGWQCELHPDTPWQHENCAGPRMPCSHPKCPDRRRDME